MELMCIEVNGMRIIDSLNFLPMPLAAMPKTFGEAEIKKGYFPHFFNKTENWNYIGPLPNPEMYGADSMKTGMINIFAFALIILNILK
jgi:hypothetical protein